MSELLGETEAFVEVVQRQFEESNTWDMATLECGLREALLKDGGNASGDMVVDGIEAAYIERPTGGPSTRAQVTIRNYANVSIGFVTGYNVHTGSSPATEVTITSNIPGDIVISGPIDLTAVDSPANSGALRLAAGGTVTLGDLHLGKVRYVRLSSAVRRESRANWTVSGRPVPAPGPWAIRS